MTTGPLITVQDIRKVYRQRGVEFVALDGISFTVAAGDYLAIVGRSGSGKSTLLHLCAGLDVPDTGSITIGQHDITQFNEAERARLRRKTIGLVFQSFNLLGNLTVLQNVMLPALLMGRSQKQVRDEAQELLRELSIDSHAKQLPSQLSGGQQQRTAIARALINHPQILLADEPTGNLDSQTSEDVLALLRSFHSKGQTIIFITHDTDAADQAHQKLILKDGKIISTISHLSAEPILKDRS